MTHLRTHDARPIPLPALDLPRPGPTHLYVKSDPQVRVSTLVENLSRGYYLLDAMGPARLLAGGKRFALPVCGFAIDGGRPTGSVAGAQLVGPVTSLLHDVVAAARDLDFLPSRHGMIGAPTLLVKGLEIRRLP